MDNIIRNRDTYVICYVTWYSLWYLLIKTSTSKFGFFARNYDKAAYPEDPANVGDARLGGLKRWPFDLGALGSNPSHPEYLCSSCCYKLLTCTALNVVILNLKHSLTVWMPYTLHKDWTVNIQIKYHWNWNKKKRLCGFLPLLKGRNKKPIYIRTFCVVFNIIWIIHTASAWNAWFYCVQAKLGVIIMDPYLLF